VVSIPSIRGIISTHPKIATVSGAFHAIIPNTPRPGPAALLLPALPALAEPPKSDADVPKWLDEHIAAVLPTAAEKHFDEIGWFTQILAAEKLAKQHSRPGVSVHAQGPHRVGPLLRHGICHASGSARR